MPSLLVADLIETFGQVPSALPQCAGAIFSCQDGRDMGSPQPVTDIIGELIVDGERPYGRRASNRTMTLPILIRVPDTGDYASDLSLLVGARETLLQAIDAQTWTLKWTRDGGQTLVFDCFRAAASVITYSTRYDQALCSQLTISFQALPYGRSDTPIPLAFASPLSGGVPAPPSPQTLDGYEGTITGTNWSSSTAHIAGSKSAHWTAPAATNPAPTYTSTFSAKDLTGLTVLQHWIGFASPAYWFYFSYGGTSNNVSLTYTLKDSAGHSLVFGTTMSSGVSQTASSPIWTQVTANLPSSLGSFDIAHVVSCAIKIANSAGTNLNYTDAFLDDLTAQPVTSASAASIRGNVYTIRAVGTSHAPVSLEFEQSGLTTWKLLVAHRPGPDSPTSLTPWVSVGNGADTPNGATNYPVVSAIGGVNARFGGTYTVIAVASDLTHSPSSPHTLTVGVTQTDYSGGPVTAQTCQRTFTPSAEIVNNLVVVGELTLPARDIPPDNTAMFHGVTITSSNTLDRFLDVLLIDVLGQLVIINTSTGYVRFYLDEPGSSVDIGRVLGSSTDRTRAVSVLDSTFLSGGPPVVDSGNSPLFVYSPSGAPSVGASYSPRYFVDRVD